MARVSRLLNGCRACVQVPHVRQARNLDLAGQLARSPLPLGIPPRASYAHQTLTEFDEEMQWENGP